MPALHNALRVRGTLLRTVYFVPVLGLLILLTTGNVSAQEKWEALDRFRTAASQNAPEQLLMLADEWDASADPREKHLALLTRAAAAVRSDDLATALSELDSLLVHVPKNEISIRATARQFLSNSLTMLGDPERGLEEAEAGILELPSSGYILERIALMNTRAEAMLVDGRDMDSAFDAFAENAQFSISVKSALGEGGAENGMGLIRLNQLRFPEAEKHFRSSLELAREAGSEMLMQNVVANISLTAAMDGRHDMALRLCDSLLLALGTRSPEFRASLHNEMGFIHRSTGEREEAMIDFLNAIALLDPLPESLTTVQTNQNLASEYWASGRKDDAFSTMNKALSAAERMRWTEIQAQIHKELHDWYGSLGLASEALKHLQTHVVLADSVNKSRYDAELARSEALYGSRKMERHISAQEEALEVSKEETRLRSLQRNVLIGATVALVLLAMLLFKLLRDRRRFEKKEKELHDEQVDQLLSQQEIKSINAMLEGQEMERDRVARDLHDRLGSMLGGIKVNMAALEDRVEQMQHDEQCHKVNRLLDQAVGELRQISHNMAAATLSRFGLEKALKDLRDTIHVNGRLSVELNVFGIDHRLERSVELAVYRIVQELVSNALKHSQARELCIGVTHSPGRLSVVVADNGKGFDFTHPAEGMGLSNVRSRAAALGASVQVDSTPGKGTTVSVECPLVE